KIPHPWQPSRNWSRTGIAQTSLGFNGRFWPGCRPLFQGTLIGLDEELLSLSMIASVEPATLSAAPADGQAMPSGLGGPRGSPGSSPIGLAQAAAAANRDFGNQFIR